MENQTKLIAQRLMYARQNAGLTTKQIADKCGLKEERYIELESGAEDYSFTFLYKCANALSMDISELVSGQDPKLTFYNINKAGEGMPIKRRTGFDYRHLSPNLKDRLAEPFVVTAKYDPELEETQIAQSTHKGQEFNYVLSGTLRVMLDDHTMDLNEGDSVFYDSTHRHGMIAVGGKDCQFLAFVLKNEGETTLDTEPIVVKVPEVNVKLVDERYNDCIYHEYAKETVDDKGFLIDFKAFPTENFNFSYDILDKLAVKKPEQTALLWVSGDKSEVRRFSFSEMSKLTNKTANYFRSLGIEKGDKVMLVLKRHYQFWPSVLALHKLGAIGIPATNLLVAKDYIYRFDAAHVKAIVCTSEDNCCAEVEEAQKSCPSLTIKSIAKGKRDGWSDFDTEVEKQSDIFERVETHRDDPSMMFFTSGTTGYPKITTHTFAYPLGHIVTARWWQHVKPGGLHLTISDTGWAKSLWGKLYGQWLCECAVFAYDMERFSAEDLLPMFAEHGITSLCAPPTIFRFLIKENLERFDLSSLEHAVIAGEALNPEVFNQFYNATGLMLMEGFGQTESTVTIFNQFGTIPKPGSMGKPSPAYHVDLVREDGTSADVGETGEIVLYTDEYVCGMFDGYYENDEKTSEVWNNNVYHTGDNAWRDENGYYWFVGRIDDVIKSSGYRIGPFEIESVIMELPYVLECAVTGIPDETRGQLVKASIVLTKGTVGTEELKKEIQDYVKTHTAPYKYPRKVEFLESLPKTISGKIRRVELKNN